MKNPRTASQWRVAVDAAQGWLTFDAARQFGFVSRGPSVDVQRCEEILRRGRKLGYVPQANALEVFARKLADLAR